MRAQLEFLKQVEQRIAEVSERVVALRSARSQASDAAQRVAKALGGAAEADGESEEPSVPQRVEEAAKALGEKLSAIESELMQTKSRSFEDPLNYPGKLTAHLAHLHAVANSGSDAPPTQGSRERLADLEAQMGEVFGRLDAIMETDVVAFNELVAGVELPAIVMKGKE